MKRSAAPKFAAGAVAALGLATVIGAGGYWSGAHAGDLSSSPLAAQPGVAPPSFATLIQRVAPAVVSIDVTLRPSKENVQFAVPQGFGQGSNGDDSVDDGQSSQGQGSPFQFFFGAPGQGGQQGIPGFPGLPFGDIQRGGQAPVEQATGSGFLISPDGYIVTNNHVVQGATSITVRLADKRSFKARLVGRDPATDLAVVKIDGSGFSYVNFEEKAKPRVGDWVVAVGNPYDLGGTATAGIVSALGRENVSGSSFVDYMQIDAPINRGNSGGPTFDVYGRVVGVNSAIYSPSGGSVGIGFAIPADVAQSVASQLIAHGEVERGYIGALIQNVNPDIASSLGIKANQGAIVAELTPGGPASRSGLQVGDVIVGVDGAPVASSSALTQRIALIRAGQEMQLQVLRNGRPLTVSLRSGLRPSEAQLASNDGSAGAESGDGTDNGSANARVLGMRLAPLDQASRQQFGIARQGSGVVVEGVGQDSDAADKGLHSGDVIVRAGSRQVVSPQDVSAAVAEAKRTGRSDVLLLVSRKGQTIFVPLKVNEANG